MMSSTESRREPLDFDAILSPSEDQAELRIRGEVDAYTAPMLWEKIEPALSDANGGPLIIDLADMTFIDSSGLLVLVRTLKRLRNQDRGLVLRSPTSSTRRLLALSGFDKVFRIEG